MHIRDRDIFPFNLSTGGFKVRKLVVLFTALLLFTGGAFAQSTIVGSAHDLSSSNTTANYYSDESEVCIFCHTPHNATKTQVPLWNRSDPTTVYTTYYTGTIDAYTSSGTTIDGSSLLCLSCHDGTVSLNSIANGGTPTMTGGDYLTSNIGGGDGTALADDHPVSFTYATAQAADAGLKDVDYHLEDGKVQCSSCHDVHAPGTTAAGDYPFLRESNNGSALCLECHDK